MNRHLHDKGTDRLLTDMGIEPEGEPTGWESVDTSTEDADDTTEPTEPAEDDATITPCGRLGGMTAAAFGGKFLGEFKSDAAALNAIRREAKRQGWYPSVWSISDHGNAHRMDGFRFDLFDSEAD